MATKTFPVATLPKIRASRRRQVKMQTVLPGACRELVPALAICSMTIGRRSLMVWNTRRLANEIKSCEAMSYKLWEGDRDRGLQTR